MADQDPKVDPSVHSPGNPGARGSRGQPNRGASEQDIPNSGTERAPENGEPDLRGDADARGGGGLDSNSSRSS